MSSRGRHLHSDLAFRLLGVNPRAARCCHFFNPAQTQWAGTRYTSETSKELKISDIRENCGLKLLIGLSGRQIHSSVLNLDIGR